MPTLQIVLFWLIVCAVIVATGWMAGL